MVDFAIRALSTLVGALAAFALAAWREKRRERDQRIQSFKSSLFVLLMQRTFLRNLKGQYLDPMRDHPIRAYTLHPSVAHVVPAESLNLDSLAFLLVVEQAELVNHLLVAQARYQSVIALLEARNAAHASFQDKLEAVHASRQLTQGTLDDIRSIAGKALSARLEPMSDELFGFTDEAIETNRAVYVAAVAAFRQMFPGAAMFGVEDVPLVSQKSGAVQEGADDTR